MNTMNKLMYIEQHLRLDGSLATTVVTIILNDADVVSITNVSGLNLCGWKRDNVTSRYEKQHIEPIEPPYEVVPIWRHWLSKIHTCICVLRETDNIVVWKRVGYK